MQVLTKYFALLVALIVFAAATGVPQVIHLCTSVCEQAVACCDAQSDQGEDNDCCSDLIAIHKIDVLRGVEASVPSAANHSLLFSHTALFFVADLVWQSFRECAFALNSYHQYLFSDHPPKPETTPLRC